MLGDVISGVVDIGSMGLSTAAGNIAGGKLRGFGVSTSERLPDYPDIATMREQGFDLVAAMARAVWARRLPSRLCPASIAR